MSSDLHFKMTEGGNVSFVRKWMIAKLCCRKQLLCLRALKVITTRDTLLASVAIAPHSVIIGFENAAFLRALYDFTKTVSWLIPKVAALFMSGKYFWMVS